MLNIDKAKGKIQKDNSNYIVGAKFVTKENAETVISSIEKDLRIYNNAVRFIIRDNMIEIMLDSNATLCVYYFTGIEVFRDVVRALPEFGLDILNL
ncbi:MAG: hypothetical protein IKE95_01525 [Methanobrevibacter sp.]|nr:hypothetical protein [Methanobrevibacter sp.]